jgi:hypothetical protein
MEQRPSWGANSHSASQEIPRLLWNPKVHCYVHKNPSLVLLLNQMNPVHTLPPKLPKANSNIILQSTRRSFEWSLLFRFSNRNFVCISHVPHACYMPAILVFDFITLIKLDGSVQFITLLIMQSSPASRHFHPLGSKYSPQHLVPEYPSAWDTKFHIHYKVKK